LGCRLSNKGRDQAPIPPTLRTLLTRRTLLLLVLAMFLSMAGLHLLLVALAVDWLKATGSSAYASLVYVAQILAPIALTRVAARQCATISPRRVLIACEIGGMTIALLFALGVTSVWVILPILAVRGYLDMLVKSTRAVALKAHMEPSAIELASTLSTASFLLGAFVGGIIGTALIGSLSTQEIALVTLGLSCIATLLYAALPFTAAPRTAQAGTPDVLRTALAAFSRDHSLGRAFIYLVATSALFQGVHQTARLHIPMRELGLGGAGVSALQACAFGGVFVGLVLAGRFFTGSAHGPRILPVFTLAAAMAGCVASLAASVVPTFTAYFVFMLLYELTFVVSMNTVVARSPANDLPVLMVLFYASSFGGMALVAGAAGLVMDAWGSWPIFCAIAVMVAAAVTVGERLRPRATPADSST
jgi:predicted MFS family arabinose efflux permease